VQRDIYVGKEIINAVNIVTSNILLSKHKKLKVMAKKSFQVD
jgi:hypothetical protein